MFGTELQHLPGYEGFEEWQDVTVPGYDGVETRLAGFAGQVAYQCR